MAHNERAIHPEPEEKLEIVFTSNDESEALVVKSLLESNGFEVVMSTPEAPINVLPAANLGSLRILVREEVAPEVRRLIEESEHGGPENAEEAERLTEE